MRTVLIAALALAAARAAAAGDLTYPIVDTMQDRCFSEKGETAWPKAGERFFGQDAQYEGNAARYEDHGDGTVSDLVTGLMWQKTPDLERKSTWADALAGAKSYKLAGHADWRLPTGKRFVSRLDKDGDGKVSKSEFDGPPEHFKDFDRNGDGFITADEAPSGPPPGRDPPGGGGPR